MNLLYYTAVKDGAGEGLRRVIEELVPEEKVEVYRTIGGLSERLCRSTYDVDVGVFLATSNQDLMGMLSISDLIRDIRIILVLPDTEDDTIAKGHSLRPRFLTHTDSNFLEVAAVLSKMLVIRGTTV